MAALCVNVEQNRNITLFISHFACLCVINLVIATVICRHAVMLLSQAIYQVMCSYMLVLANNANNNNAGIHLAFPTCNRQVSFSILQSDVIPSSNFHS